MNTYTKLVDDERMLLKIFLRKKPKQFNKQNSEPADIQTAGFFGLTHTNLNFGEGVINE